MVDYAEEVSEIEEIGLPGERAHEYADLASRLREERDQLKAERDDLKRLLDPGPEPTILDAKTGGDT